VFAAPARGCLDRKEQLEQELEQRKEEQFLGCSFIVTTPSFSSNKHEKSHEIYHGFTVKG
jgi:hypothetical protein